MIKKFWSQFPMQVVLSWPYNQTSILCWDVRYHNHFLTAFWFIDFFRNGWFTIQKLLISWNKYFGIQRFSPRFFRLLFHYFAFRYLSLLRNCHLFFWTLLFAVAITFYCKMSWWGSDGRDLLAVIFCYLLSCSFKS